MLVLERPVAFCSYSLVFLFFLAFNFETGRIHDFCLYSLVVNDRFVMIYVRYITYDSTPPFQPCITFAGWLYIIWTEIQVWSVQRSWTLQTGVQYFPHGSPGWYRVEIWVCIVWYFANNCIVQWYQTSLPIFDIHCVKVSRFNWKINDDRLKCWDVGLFYADISS